ncbi:hypothetical protein F9278_45790 [Streptomyces phaeolivaceus]|uniref:Uncharacterized protein n=1 Tax=Streptomyces phaeolivaceus TaxID=2653200 RepID=A0A5P8KG56_9ACTN|nr:hypothetical protein [Streptomyces phaeolivaceus]QFR02246.1 hypothetical protein F9278_45790 [Streptomyces phaeolivaceus]
MIEHVLRLYPAAYRQAHGGEIAATYREMTAGEPLSSRLREGAGLAAHAMRVRMGLGSASPVAQVLALAYPFALAASAAACGLHLLRWYAGLVASPTPLGVQLGTDLRSAWGALLVSSLIVVAGAASALAGRWRAGVPCTVAGLLVFAVAAVAAVVSGPAFGDPVVTPAAMALAAAVVLACPPDRRPENTSAGWAGMAGAVIALVIVPRAAIDARAVPWVSTDYGCWPVLVLAAAGVVLTWRSGSRGGRELGAMALASPPLLAPAYTTAWGETTAAACLAAVLPTTAVIALLVGRSGRTGRAFP